MSVTRGRDIEFADLPGRRSGDPLRSTPAASSVRIVQLTRGETRFAHRHPLSEEVIFVARGTGVVVVGDSRHGVGPGDVVHVPPGTAHATIPDPGVEMELVCFFPHPMLDENLEETSVDVMSEEIHE